MTIQKIVSPAQIEPELLAIWEGLATQNKMRASLFNLIVFNCLSPRTDYIRNIVQKVVEKFPCRTLFISSDPDAPHPYLKTAVSVVTPQLEETSIACDQIDIGVSGSDIDQVPSVILPHIVPDLPVYLLWAEDPSKAHPLFEPLLKLSNRLILDSESADSLLAFSQKILAIHEKTKIDIADLNWARTEAWRELIGATFSTEERVSQIQALSFLKISYNGRKTDFFCHLKIQSLYLLSWISNQLNWNFKQATKDFVFQFENREAKIEAEKLDELRPGIILSVDFENPNGFSFVARRDSKIPDHIKIQISNKDKCDLPFRFILGQTDTGQSLVKEICTKGTSSHYLQMLKTLNQLDQDKLC